MNDQEVPSGLAAHPIVGPQTLLAGIGREFVALAGAVSAPLEPFQKKKTQEPPASRPCSCNRRSGVLLPGTGAAAIRLVTTGAHPRYL